jgi:hypothetical protein
MSMKGYLVGFGYMGWIPQENRYRLFATEEEYREIFSSYSETVDV